MSASPTDSGRWRKRLPEGFSYVEGSASSDAANAAISAAVADQIVTFTVVAVDSFTYKVTVGPDVEDGRYLFDPAT